MLQISFLSCFLLHLFVQFLQLILEIISGMTQLIFLNIPCFIRTDSFRSWFYHNRIIGVDPQILQAGTAEDRAGLHRQSISVLKFFLCVGWYGCRPKSEETLFQQVSFQPYLFPRPVNHMYVHISGAVSGEVDTMTSGLGVRQEWEWFSSNVEVLLHLVLFFGPHL